MNAADRRNFTAEEIALIRARYPTEGAVLLARELDRPRQAIINKALNLGIRCHKARTPAPANAHCWTEVEDQRIRAAWPKVQRRQLSAVRLAEQLGVSVSQVRGRAGDLGLRQQRIKEPVWSAEEDELLAQWIYLSLPIIRKRLLSRGYRRTEGAISVRRQRLSLSVRGNGEYYSANELSQLLGISPQPILRWIRLGWLPAKPRSDSRNAWGGPGDQYLISVATVRHFIITHAAHVAPHLATADKIWLIDLLANNGNAAPPVLRQDWSGVRTANSDGFEEMRVLQ